MLLVQVLKESAQLHMHLIAHNQVLTASRSFTRFMQQSIQLRTKVKPDMKQISRMLCSWQVCVVSILN